MQMPLICPAVRRSLAAASWPHMRRLRVSWLPDGKRLHLNNGPVNMIIQAFGAPAEVGRAYEAAIARARALVFELTEDLPRLPEGEAPTGMAVRRAREACAAVPGALAPATALHGAMADEVVQAMAQGGQIERGFANSHGMVALHLAAGQFFQAAQLDWAEYGRYDTKVPILHITRTRGLAGGGWHFDRFALGCIERIFTAAPSAAIAQAALGAISASMVVPGAKIMPATQLAPHSLLGAHPVFAPLQAAAADESALIAAGGAAAQALFDAGIITLAAMSMGKSSFLAGPPQFTLRSAYSLEM